MYAGDDGSFMIHFDSTTHPECPARVSHTRARLHATFYIEQRLDYAEYAHDLPQCRLTFVLQLEPPESQPDTNLRNT